MEICPVCEHHRRAEIEAFVRNGDPEPLEAVARAYGLRMTAIARHHMRCMNAYVHGTIGRKLVSDMQVVFAESKEPSKYAAVALEEAIGARMQKLETAFDMCFRIALEEYLAGRTAKALEAMKVAVHVSGGGLETWARLQAEIAGAVKATGKLTVNVNAPQQQVVLTREHLPPALKAATDAELMHFAETSPDRCDVEGCRVHSTATRIDLTQAVH